MEKRTICVKMRNVNEMRQTCLTIPSVHGYVCLPSASDWQLRRATLSLANSSSLTSAQLFFSSVMTCTCTTSHTHPTAKELLLPRDGSADNFTLCWHCSSGGKSRNCCASARNFCSTELISKGNAVGRRSCCIC